MEQACLEEIVKGIKHCKTNITQCNKVLDKASLSVIPVWTAKKEAFTDNLTIWNTLGHIQIASIEMKQYTKRLSADNNSWELQDAIKSAYISIAEFREDNAGELKHVRNNVAAHRDNDVCNQLDISENLHLSDAVKLVVEYGNIINELGTAISPIKELGIKRLAMVY